MATTIQHRRGKPGDRKEMPSLSEGEIGLRTDTGEAFIGGSGGNIPFLMLTEAAGRRGITNAATSGSDDLITSGAVYEALRNAGTSFETDDTLTLKDGVLKVNTANVVEEDNTLPVTSAAVHVTVGNIEALLEII